MVSRLSSSDGAPSDPEPGARETIRETSWTTVMGHLDVRDSRFSRIVSDEPMVKRATGFRFTEGPVWRRRHRPRAKAGSSKGAPSIVR